MENKEGNHNFVGNLQGSLDFRVIHHCRLDFANI